MARAPVKGFVALFLVVGSLSRCGSDSGTSPTSPTSPTPPPAAVEVLVGAGDIADCGVPGAAATARLLDSISGTVMAIGDLAYPNGTSSDYATCFAPAWGRHKSRIRPVPGNHDYYTPGAAGYFGYFGSQAGTVGEGYYSYRLGNWLVVALNSNIPLGPGSAQYEWLRRALADAPGPCVAAYVHHPLFTSGPNGPNPQIRPLWDLLHAAGAELVVSGHDHLYERFAPQDPNGHLEQTRGVRQFVAGTGGAPLYDFFGPQPNSEVRIRSWGVLRLTLDNGFYSWEFVATEGGVGGDRGSEACH